MAAETKTPDAVLVIQGKVLDSAGIRLGMPPSCRT